LLTRRMSLPQHRAWSPRLTPRRRSTRRHNVVLKKVLPLEVEAPDASGAAKATIALAGWRCPLQPRLERRAFAVHSLPLLIRLAGFQSSGRWGIVRGMGVPGPEKRKPMRERICPISGRVACPRPVRELCAREIIRNSGADTVEYFDEVV